MEYKNRIVKVENVNPKKLKANPDNFREHPMTQSKAMIGSLEELGWISGVIVNVNTGNLIDGHLRVELAIKNGEDEIPVTYVDLTEEEERKALVVYDSITYMANENKTKIKEILENVKTSNNNVQLAIDALKKRNNLIERLSEENNDDTDIDEEEVNEDTLTDKLNHMVDIYGVEAGQTWRLGKHYISCGDCFSIENISGLLGNNKINVLFTDPPYGVDYVSNYRLSTLSGGKEELEIKGDKSVNIKWLDSVMKFMHTNSVLYICTKWNVYSEWEAEIKKRIAIKNLIIINKLGFHGMGDLAGDYAPSYEMIIFCSKGNIKIKGKRERNIWDINHDNRNTFMHPTQKEIDIPYKGIIHFSDINDIVFDPFLGSGSTLLASEKLNRVCYGMEIEPKYIALTLYRWEQMTGKKVEKVK